MGRARFDLAVRRPLPRDEDVVQVKGLAGRPAVEIGGSRLRALPLTEVRVVGALQTEFLEALDEPVNRVLSLGPQPHPYRRIKVDGDGLRLAVKDWRVRFHVEGRTVTVEQIQSGYRASELASSAQPEVALQRAFVARFT